MGTAALPKRKFLQKPQLVVPFLGQVGLQAKIRGVQVQAEKYLRCVRDFHDYHRLRYCEKGPTAQFRRFRDRLRLIALCPLRKGPQAKIRGVQTEKSPRCVREFHVYHRLRYGEKGPAAQSRRFRGQS